MESVGNVQNDIWKSILASRLPYIHDLTCVKKISIELSDPYTTWIVFVPRATVRRADRCRPRQPKAGFP